MKPVATNEAPYRECAIATWLLVLIFLLVKQVNPEIIGYLVLVCPYAILLYWFCYTKIIPGILAKGQDYRIYLLKVIFIISLTIRLSPCG
jgi:hypothetical protein